MRIGLRILKPKTCVEASRPGPSYRAAGWQCVGRTQGRPPGAAAAVEPKSVQLQMMVRVTQASRAR